MSPLDRALVALVWAVVAFVMVCAVRVAVR